MFRPEFAARPAAGLPEFDRIGLSQASPSGGFSALMREVRSEVSEFIEHGSPDLGLSASGQALRLRQQTAAAASGLQTGGAANPSFEAAARVLGLANLTRARITDSVPAEIGAKPLSSDGNPDRQAFLKAIGPWANEAAERLGVAPEIVAAQAALESGWGRRPVREADGRDTHNLFGIKAGTSWQGDVAEALTTEFEDGAAVRRPERFRSYPDHASAFRDFTRLLLDNPRYRAALNTGDDVVAYAQGLAQGGYATDPRYADKLARIAARLQRAD